MLRRDDRVACEGRLFKVGYELRKVHKAWLAGIA
jgi:hypothetical protein